METALTWSNWLTIEKRLPICKSCENYLEKIAEPRCQRCSRTSQKQLCFDCREWQRLGDNIEANYSIFNYNQQMKQIISAWKFRGDYVLREIFRAELQATFLTHFAAMQDDVVLVPVPLSKNRMQERGFNQSLALAEMIEAPIQEVLGRNVGEKQAKKDRKTRLRRENPFFVNMSIQQTAVIIDDIYTTGTTIRQAAQQLKNAGCPKVYSITLARS